jgi:hypothetical protein
MRLLLESMNNISYEIVILLGLDVAAHHVSGRYEGLATYHAALSGKVLTISNVACSSAATAIHIIRSCSRLAHVIGASRGIFALSGV